MKDETPAALTVDSSSDSLCSVASVARLHGGDGSTLEDEDMDSAAPTEFLDPITMAVMERPVTLVEVSPPAFGVCAVAPPLSRAHPDPRRALPLYCIPSVLKLILTGYLYSYLGLLLVPYRPVTPFLVLTVVVAAPRADGVYL